MKVLYIYSGERKNKFQGVIGKDFPDTQFYGLNHLSSFGIQAEYKEPDDVIKIRFLRKILGWRFRHFLMFFTARHYDIVFGISIIYMMLWRKLIPARKTKFILYNSVLKRLLMANKNKPVKLFLLKSLLKELDGVITLSLVQKKYLEEKLSFLRGKVFSVPIGVDIDFYKYTEKGRKNYYLSVGRDNSRDYETIVDVAREMPDREFHFVCLPRNVEKIKDLPDNTKVFFNLSFPDLRRKLEEARALLLITHDDSRFDGSGEASGVTVLVEAMAVGIPIIASHKNYIDEYVKNNEDALLVDLYSKEQIKKSILKLDDSQIAHQLTKHARRRTEIEFSTSIMAAKFADIFKKIQ